MTPFLLSLLLSAQPIGGDDCIFDALPISSRTSIGEAVLAKRHKERDVLDALMKATDGCARKNGWSAEQAVHANGYSTMRFAADSIAGRLGHPSWSSMALKAIRLRPLEQVRNLAATGAGNAEFELVLAQMIGDDPAIPAVIKSSNKETIELFVLMIKLLAVGELERSQLQKG